MDHSLPPGPTAQRGEALWDQSTAARRFRKLIPISFLSNCSAHLFPGVACPTRTFSPPSHPPHLCHQLSSHFPNHASGRHPRRPHPRGLPVSFPVHPFPSSHFPSRVRSEMSERANGKLSEVRGWAVRCPPQPRAGVCV